MLGPRDCHGGLTAGYMASNTGIQSYTGRSPDPLDHCPSLYFLQFPFLAFPFLRLCWLVVLLGGEGTGPGHCG
jgi:hypothetical protein